MAVYPLVRPDRNDDYTLAEKHRSRTVQGGAAMRIGVMVGPGAGPLRHEGRAAAADARWAEEAGLAVGLDPADPRRLRRAHRGRAHRARRPSRIEIGTAVVPVQPRHPIALAQQALSVQAVCEGRLSLGLGVSHHWIIDEMLGLPYEQPVATMRAYLDVLDQALAGPGHGRRRERRVPGAQPARHHRRRADAGAARRPRAR